MLGFGIGLTGLGVVVEAVGARALECGLPDGEVTARARGNLHGVRLGAEEGRVG